MAEQQIMKLLQAERQLVKNAFYENQRQVLAALPESYKSLWGRVGFAKTNWGDEWLPCLFLGPYDVSPTSAMRQLWMEMFVSMLETCIDVRGVVFPSRARSRETPLVSLHRTRRRTERPCQS